jgi:hypothetical protein
MTPDQKILSVPRKNVRNQRNSGAMKKTLPKFLVAILPYMKCNVGGFEKKSKEVSQNLRATKLSHTQNISGVKQLGSQLGL